MGGKVLLFPLVLALGLANICYALWLGSWKRADPFITIFGVLAVYLGAVGCRVY